VVGWRAKNVGDCHAEAVIYPPSQPDLYMVDFQSRDTSRGEVADADEPQTPDGTGGDAETQPAEPEPPETDAPEDDANDVLGFAVVTVGSERSVDDDPAGDAVVSAVDDVGEVVSRDVIDDRYDGVQSTAGRLAERGDVDVIVTVGGTGVEPDDVTVEAVEPLLDKRLPGVGELVRRHCAEHGGTAAIRTRSMGGTFDGVPVFCLPGDPDLAQVAAVEIVVPEAEPLAELASLPEAAQ
jgi:molybdenum cofactor biosynthesis protein B